MKKHDLQLVVLQFTYDVKQKFCRNLRLESLSPTINHEIT